MIKSFLLDVFFPRFCFNCGREGNYLCQDCEALLDILEDSFCLCQIPQRLPIAGKCKRCQSKKLNGLYFALSYENHLAKKLIQQFKYQPFLKDLAKTLSSLIITHFQLLNNKPNFADFILVPVPLEKRKLRKRGFNQAEELAKELSLALGIPLIVSRTLNIPGGVPPVINDVLIKVKETLPQVELAAEAREENIKGVFLIKNGEKIAGQKILLVDDVYTTGATMTECARLLKEAGAKEIWGVVIARD